ncbi:MAG: hypothetical protein K2G99_04035 [Desulfovibrio sp.]|nr:hypothetical protein [Desulfovibrio sp.]
MCQGIALLDEALVLARQERAALESANYEEAIELAGRRGELTDMAWSMLAPDAVEDYRSRLAEQARLQEELTGIAGRARDEVRRSLNHSRQEQRRMRGYHQAVGQALQ